MKSLMRPVLALCTVMLLGLTLPAAAQTERLRTADPQVCCSYTDANGNKRFFLAPKSQCPRERLARMERCEGGQDKEVCCLTHNGYFKTTAKRCRAARGSVEPNRYCDNPNKKICCKTRSGPRLLIPNRCVTSGGTPVHMRNCRRLDRKVCCKTPNGYYDWTATQCRRARGKVVNARYCKQSDRRVCCKTRRGYSWESARKCRPPAGAPVNARYCRGQNADRICCKYPKADGTAGFGFMHPKKCKSVKGNKVPNRYCLKATDDLKLRRNLQRR